MSTIIKQGVRLKDQYKGCNFGSNIQTFFLSKNTYNLIMFPDENDKDQVEKQGEFFSGSSAGICKARL